MAMKAKCKIAGCNKTAYARGYCQMHYHRVRRGSKDMRPEKLSSLRWLKDDPRRKGNCSLEDCNKPNYAKGLCRKHYNLNKRNGFPGYKIRLGKPPCGVSGCNKESRSKGLCELHYHRSKRGTDLSMPKRETLKGENNPNWKGGVFQYKNHYEMKKARLVVLELDGYKCFYCGKKADRIHHIDGSKDNHNLHNLVSACAKCNAGNRTRFNTNYRGMYGMFAAEIQRNFGLSKNEVRFYHENRQLKNLIKTSPPRLDT